MNKIPFDISFKERIERGKVKVVTRDNREVTIIKWDLKGNYPIVACVKVEVCNYEGDESWFEERPYAFSKEGKRYKGFPEDKSDIFILVEEPVSEDLNTAAKEYANNITKKIGYRLQLRRAVCFGANWQKEKMMKEAIEGIARPDDSEIWCNLSSFNLKDGDKVEIVIVKSK